MTDAEFRALLDLWMCSDPWPIKPDPEDQCYRTLEGLLDKESVVRGYDNWTVAYHELPGGSANARP